MLVSPVFLSFESTLRAWAKQVAASLSPPIPVPKAATPWELSTGNVRIRDERNTEEGHLQSSSAIRNNRWVRNCFKMFVTIPSSSKLLFVSYNSMSSHET